MVIKELSVIDNLSSLEREIIKSKLSDSFLSEEIVNKIEIDIHGRVKIHSVPWAKFWRALHIPYDIAELLNNFKDSRNKYFNSGFCSNKISNYCYSFFVLLSRVLEKYSQHRQDNDLRAILIKLLCLENFAIRWFRIDSKDLAAGTTSHRNPLYLLAKLKNHKMLEDPKYLPILALPNNHRVNMFYHYRQYKLNRNPNFSLFLYPAVSHELRASSFNLIESFTKGFSKNSDPRSRQRAIRISDSTIYPFLNKLYSNEEHSGKLKIKMADIGGGNGALVSHIWRHIQSVYDDVASQWHLICSFVGLRVQNPVRHFKSGNILCKTSYLEYCQSDYRNWLESNSSNKHGLDVILLCRLLNNISNFDISKTSDTKLISEIVGKRYNQELAYNNHLPSICLKPDSYRPDNLILTNGRVELKNARTYRSLSLSDYYKGLFYCKQGNTFLDDSVYYPVRRFKLDALVMPNGTSLIRKLSQTAKLVVIEDTDLNEQVLAEHFEKFKLTNYRAIEVNKNRRCSSKIFAVNDKKFNPFFPESVLS